MKSKRLLTWILAVVLMVSALCFVACGDNTPKAKVLENLDLPTLAENEMVVVEKVATDEYKYFVVALTGDLSEKSSLQDVLEYIRDTYKVTLDIQSGFINKFDQLPDPEKTNEYVYLYTSVEKDFDTSAHVTTFDCDGVTVKTSAVGCASMSVKAGCVIYIETIVWNG